MNFSSEEAKKALSKQAKKERDLLIKEFMIALIDSGNSFDKVFRIAENAADEYLKGIGK